MAGKRTSNEEKYIVGSNAVAYDYTTESTEGSKQHREPSRLSIKKKTANPVYTVVMVTMIMVMMLVCVLMLKTQFTVAHTSEEVINLKHQLTALRRENAHLQSTINEQLDLVEIKRMAMEDYGMVYPSEDEVIYIESVASSYTVQYATIEAPKKERISIGNVLAFMTRGW